MGLFHVQVDTFSFPFGSLTLCSDDHRSDPEAGVCMDINFINKHTPMKRDVIIGSPEPYVPGQVRKEVAVFPYKEEDLAAANERLAKRGLYFVA